MPHFRNFCFSSFPRSCSFSASSSPIITLDWLQKGGLHGPHFSIQNRVVSSILFPSSTRPAFHFAWAWLDQSTSLRRLVTAGNRTLPTHSFTLNYCLKVIQFDYYKTYCIVTSSDKVIITMSMLDLRQFLIPAFFLDPTNQLAAQSSSGGAKINLNSSFRISDLLDPTSHSTNEPGNPFCHHFPKVIAFIVCSFNHL